MRPLATSSTEGVDAGFRHWNSPMPYLFGGLAFMLVLIAAALIILACSYKKSSSSENTITSHDPRKAASDKQEMADMKMEAKIVVIMPGDDNPTYLAKPVSVNLHDQV